MPSEINKFIREGEQAYIPVEQINVLDAADVLIWGTETDADQAALEKVPGFSSLAAVKAGRSIYTGGTLSGAIYFTSPLSLPYVLETWFRRSPLRWADRARSAAVGSLSC